MSGKSRCTGQPPRKKRPAVRDADGTWLKSSDLVMSLVYVNGVSAGDVFPIYIRDGDDYWSKNYPIMRVVGMIRSGAFKSDEVRKVSNGQ